MSWSIAAITWVPIFETHDCRPQSSSKPLWTDLQGTVLVHALAGLSGSELVQGPWPRAEPPIPICVHTKPWKTQHQNLCETVNILNPNPNTSAVVPKNQQTLYPESKKKLNPEPSTP